MGYRRFRRPPQFGTRRSSLVTCRRDSEIRDSIIVARRSSFLLPDTRYAYLLTYLAYLPYRRMFRILTPSMPGKETRFRHSEIRDSEIRDSEIRDSEIRDPRFRNRSSSLVARDLEISLCFLYLLTLLTYFTYLPVWKRILRSSPSPRAVSYTHLTLPTN